jgi:hypothetical protein
MADKEAREGLGYLPPAKLSWAELDTELALGRLDDYKPGVTRMINPYNKLTVVDDDDLVNVVIEATIRRGEHTIQLENPSTSSKCAE